jgi:hypothetical protein
LVVAAWRSGRSTSSTRCTRRGVGYKLFAQGLIPSMERSEMQRAYRLLKEGRERGRIP